MLRLGALITPAFTSGDRQALNFAPNQLLELLLPTLSRLGDEEES
jgi:hypothetical protein